MPNVELNVDESRIKTRKALPRVRQIKNTRESLQKLGAGAVNAGLTYDGSCLFGENGGIIKVTQR